MNVKVIIFFVCLALQLYEAHACECGRSKKTQEKVVQDFLNGNKDPPQSEQQSQRQHSPPSQQQYPPSSQYQYPLQPGHQSQPQQQSQQNSGHSHQRQHQPKHSYQEKPQQYRKPPPPPPQQHGDGQPPAGFAIAPYNDHTVFQMPIPEPYQGSSQAQPSWFTEEPGTMNSGQSKAYPGGVEAEDAPPSYDKIYANENGQQRRGTI